ncbi:hypothetical protein QQS21_011953 [Conoideocrella luteorostrata]|uniref:C2H2-type domain-containing protein n=1 Tax=Conoideocrella luteorostrata TaxID=1105319 RepID=A0AAJ0CC37_9HYPO|nr:hypothetical protein QQS21_011953 [Conoideocrella luteorostrata]
MAMLLLPQSEPMCRDSAAAAASIWPETDQRGPETLDAWHGFLLTAGISQNPPSKGSSQRSTRIRRYSDDERPRYFKKRSGNRNPKDREDGDDDKDDYYDRSHTEDAGGSNNKSRLFACPFQKHQLQHSSLVDERSCRAGGFSQLDRVKKHILRHHKVLFCQCNKACKSLQQLAGHLVEGNHHTHDDPEAWQRIYRDLFPGELVPDPYIQENEDLVTHPKRRFKPPEPGTVTDLQALSQSLLHPARLSAILHDAGPQLFPEHRNDMASTTDGDAVCLRCELLDIRNSLTEFQDLRLASTRYGTSAIPWRQHPQASGGAGGFGDYNNNNHNSGSSQQNSGNPGGSDNNGSSLNTGGSGSPGSAGSGGSGESSATPMPQYGGSTIAWICCYYRFDPEGYGVRGSSRWHHCETKPWYQFCDLLKHYRTAHKKYICGLCFEVFATNNARLYHDKETSHCRCCFATFPKIASGGLFHHSREYENHTGCSAPYQNGLRDEYRWRRCFEGLLGVNSSQSYNPYFSFAPTEQPGGGAEAVSSATRQDEEIRRLGAENSLLRAENSLLITSVASLQRQVEEQRQVFRFWTENAWQSMALGPSMPQPQPQPQNTLFSGLSHNGQMTAQQGMFPHPAWQGSSDARSADPTQHHSTGDTAMGLSDGMQQTLPDTSAMEGIWPNTLDDADNFLDWELFPPSNVDLTGQMHAS